jgi:DNA-binding CsgD family transcriptional regulator
MEYLTSDDTRKLLQAIEQLYSIHHVHSFFVSCREIVDRLIPTDTPSYDLPVAICKKQSRQETTHPTSDINSPDSISEVAAVPSLDRYNKSLTQQAIDTFDDLYEIGNLTERDRSILNLLRPHLIQSYQTACKFSRQQEAILKMQESINCLGLIFLNNSGSVVTITDLAARWIDLYYANANSQQLPEQLQSWIKYQIERLKNTEGSPSPCLPLRVKRSDSELIIRLVIAPSHDRYIVLCWEEYHPPLNESLEYIGLSSREAEILALLIQGKTPKSMAKDLGISSATARKHLENIYRKLDVQSQTEAIIKALEMLGLFSCLGHLC